MLYGTRFRINGKKRPRAVLYRNEAEPHPAIKYCRTQSPEASSIAAKLEELLQEVRKLGREILDEMNNVSSRFEIIDRRWRPANGHPAVPRH